MKQVRSLRDRIQNISYERWLYISYMLSQKRCGSVLCAQNQILTEKMIEDYFLARYKYE